MPTMNGLTLRPPETFSRTHTEHAHIAGTFTVATRSGDATASLVVRVFRSNDPVTADDLCAALTESCPDADVRVVTLPAGRAAAMVRAGEYRLPPEATGHADTQVIPTYGVQLMLPASDDEHIVALDCSTNSVHGWPAIAEQAAAVAQSIHL
ncbi:hypothetical protein [Actinophytocola sp.]|uniref:hypothetical protein n=1 Tax=Actinophytocola sp. TaxID=1872138 RepID=UPI003D6A09F2